MLVVNCDVAVVGAGLAGLIAARDLAESGLDVVHLEARDRVGGRTWTKPNALGERALDMGGQWLEPAGQPRILNEIKRYGLTLEPAVGDFSVANHWLLGDTVHHGVLPVPLQQQMQLERVVAAVVTDSGRITRGVPLSSQQISDLDVSVTEYMGRLNLGPELTEIATTVPAIASCGFDPAATILHSLRLMVAAGGVYGYMGAGMETLTEGTASLTEAIAASSKTRLQLNEPVTEVDWRGPQPSVTTAAAQYQCAAVVLAVPYGTLDRISFVGGAPKELSAAVSDRIDGSGRYAEGNKIWAVVRGLPEDAIGCSPEPGMRYLSAWEDLGDGTTLAVGFARSSDPLDGDDPAAVQAAVRRMFPKVEVLSSTGHNWLHDPWTGPTWPGFSTGWIPKHEGRMLEPFGAMVAATSDFAIEWPGNMEGAVESGLHAADVVASMVR